MLLSVRHDTSYAYEGHASQVTQILRLTPRSHETQQVLEWRVTRSDGAPITAFEDGLGNICGFTTRGGATAGVTISVTGRVRTDDGEGLVSGAFEPLPPAYYLRKTQLTATTEAIRALAAEALKGATSRFALGDLMNVVRERVAYTPGATQVETPADAALSAGRGVCQDQAHVFIAAARSAGIPARYVGGYVWRGAAKARGPAPFASHAWAEAFDPEVGWIGFDPSNGVWATVSHVRVAVGLDYRQAAPISGLWRGAGEERMRVEGAVEALESAQ
jgi:transglutaminase-like putative cysteine protease